MYWRSSHKKSSRRSQSCGSLHKSADVRKYCGIWVAIVYGVGHCAHTRYVALVKLETLQRQSNITYKLACPPFHQPKSQVLAIISMSGDGGASLLDVLSSCRKVPRDIFSCLFFFGAIVSCQSKALCLNTS